MRGPPVGNGEPEREGSSGAGTSSVLGILHTGSCCRNNPGSRCRYSGQGGCSCMSAGSGNSDPRRKMNLSRSAVPQRAPGTHRCSYRPGQCSAHHSGTGWTHIRSPLFGSPPLCTPTGTSMLLSCSPPGNSHHSGTPCSHMVILRSHSCCL